MQYKKICVCGAGTMGNGIAQVSASAGYRTIVYDVNEEVLQRAKTTMDGHLQKQVEKGKLTGEEKKEIYHRLQFTSNINDCTADIIIEAIIEKMEIKTALFRRLSAINSSQTIYTSNTSSLSITQIGQSVKFPERFAGLHFFNPAPVMQLVEVVKGEHTDAAAIEALIVFARQLGKTPVICKDVPGFIVNRVARPFYIESLRLAEENEIPINTIDTLLQARGFKMGPFRLMDLIGNDINYAVSQSVYHQLNNPERLQPSYLQKEKVEKNELGKKTGKGYYNYTIEGEK